MELSELTKMSTQAATTYLKNIRQEQEANAQIQSNITRNNPFAEEAEIKKAEMMQ